MLTWISSFFYIIRQMRIISKSNKQLLLRNNIRWQATLPLTFINAALLIPNLIRAFWYSHKGLVVPPAIPLFMFFYLLINTHAVHKVLLQELNLRRIRR